MKTNGQVKIKEIRSYIIPSFGNKHEVPYGKLLVTDGKIEKEVRIKEDEEWRQYFTFKRKRYYIRNIGTLWSPVFQIIS